MEPTLIKPLGRLCADSDSEDGESQLSEDELVAEPASPYAKKVIKDL